jgi:hypothetical protein
VFVKTDLIIEKISFKEAFKEIMEGLILYSFPCPCNGTFKEIRGQ